MGFKFWQREAEPEDAVTSSQSAAGSEGPRFQDAVRQNQAGGKPKASLLEMAQAAEAQAQAARTALEKEMEDIFQEHVALSLGLKDARDFLKITLVQNRLDPSRTGYAKPKPGQVIQPPLVDRGTALLKVKYAMRMDDRELAVEAGAIHDDLPWFGQMNGIGCPAQELISELNQWLAKKHPSMTPIDPTKYAALNVTLEDVKAEYAAQQGEARGR